MRYFRCYLANHILLDHGRDVKRPREACILHWSLWVPRLYYAELYNDANNVLDKSIQSAGAAGIWRGDAVKIPFVSCMADSAVANWYFLPGSWTSSFPLGFYLSLVSSLLCQWFTGVSPIKQILGMILRTFPITALNERYAEEDKISTPESPKPDTWDLWSSYIFRLLRLVYAAIH